MHPAHTVIDAIVEDFIQPTINRLSEQLGLAIRLKIILLLANQFEERSISCGGNTQNEILEGEARILASDTFVPGRYKYKLRAVFENKENLDGFSGFSTHGAVSITEETAANKYDGFVYIYNNWTWSNSLMHVQR